VVKHANAVELRAVVAAVLAAAADAMLVSHHLPKLGAHLATALTRLSVQNLARRSSLEARSTRDKRVGGAEKYKKIRVAVRHGKQEMPVARSRDPERESEVVLPLQPLKLWAPYKPRWVRVGEVV
jgi:hypothetical protein